MVTDEQDPPAAGDQKEIQADGKEKLYVPRAERNLVSRWRRKIEAQEKRLQDTEFKRMRECMQLATEGADEAWVKSDQYVVPLIVRHINQAVANLYARDPVAIAKRRQQLQHVLWDGTPESLKEAMMAVQPPQPDPAGGPGISAATGLAWEPDPNAMAILQEVNAVREQNLMLERFAKSLEILWRYYTSEQSTGFKSLMKALVRRVKVCGVGYVQLAFQREMQKRPEIIAQIDEATSQLALIERLMAEQAEGKFDEESADAAQLKSLIEQLQQQVEVIVTEGPLFDFPYSDEIIFDSKTRHLKTWYGTGWIARKFDMTPEKVKETYGVDVSSNYKDFCRDPDEPNKSLRDMEDENGKPVSSLARLYEIQDRDSGQCMTICLGYPGFVVQPQEPDVKVERFFSVFALTFNETENPKKPIPPSDVWLIRHPQAETNRSREALRQHRIANRPMYAAAKGALDKQDKDAIKTRPAHALVELKALKQGQSVEQLLQAVKPVPIDPNLYETNQNFQDVLRAVGTQEANLGPTAGGTATESSIAENSRVASVSDNVDDLDEFLGEIAKAFSQLCLFEMSPETVKQIAGPGAVWPAVQGNRAEIAKSLWLEIKAGSSGRPNATLKVANVERLWPLLSTVPGINPRPLVEMAADLLEIDIEELYVEGLPSITALNQLFGKSVAQPATGNPATDPASQGPQGAQNQAQPAGGNLGPQPAMPAPSSGTSPVA